MTRDEAKFLLQAMRPDGSDATDPIFAEALELVRKGPELMAWWESQRNFDRTISAQLEEIPVPRSLRDRIVSQHKIVPFSPRPYLSGLFAMAAALVLVAVIQDIFFSGPVTSPGMLSDAYTASVLPMLADDKPALAMTSPDHDHVMAWLKEHESPTGTFPANLAALPSVGCQTFEVHGHTVSLICFSLSGGGLAHLFIVSERALVDPPGDFPEYGSQAGGWSTAAWTQDGKSYLLATRASPQTLRSLL